MLEVTADIYHCHCLWQSLHGDPLPPPPPPVNLKPSEGELSNNETASVFACPPLLPRISECISGLITVWK